MFEEMKIEFEKIDRSKFNWKRGFRHSYRPLTDEALQDGLTRNLDGNFLRLVYHIIFNSQRLRTLLVIPLDISS